MESVIPRPEVKSFLAEKFVPLAADCDEPNPEIEALARANLPNAMMLPFVILADAQGQWLHGNSGQEAVREFLADLLTAVSKAEGAPS